MNELEILRSQVEHWKKKAERAEAMRSKLESTLYKMKLRNVGSEASLEAIIEQADADRERLQTACQKLADAHNENLDLLNKLIETNNLKLLLPPPKPPNLEDIADDVYYAQEGERLKNRVGIIVSYHCGNAIQEYHMTQDFPGTQDDFERDVLPTIQAALGRLPTLADIGKRLEQVNREDLLSAMTYLAQFRYLEHLKSQFNKRRLEVFDSLWPQISKGYDLKHPKTYVRETALKAFNTAVEEIFKNAEQRSANSKSMGRKIGIEFVPISTEHSMLE